MDMTVAIAVDIVIFSLLYLDYTGFIMSDFEDVPKEQRPAGDSLSSNAGQSFIK